MSSIMTRLSFVIVKLSVTGVVHYLLRRDRRWKDLNLIGGHESSRDAGKLIATAKRELWEEVPSVRGVEIHLSALTDELSYGPIFSKSANMRKCYTVQYHLASFEKGVIDLIVDGLTPRSENRMVPEIVLLSDIALMSNFVSFLNSSVAGGLHAIPLSMPDVAPPKGWVKMVNSDQLEMKM